MTSLIALSLLSLIKLSMLVKVLCVIACDNTTLVVYTVRNCTGKPVQMNSKQLMVHGLNYTFDIRNPHLAYADGHCHFTSDWDNHYVTLHSGITSLVVVAIPTCIPDRFPIAISMRKGDVLADYNIATVLCSNRKLQRIHYFGTGRAAILNAEVRVPDKFRSIVIDMPRSSRDLFALIRK